ncbi:MAG: hypothetical protein JW770_02380 [Actinobacteria bacterium]|nr:hypothetical protein [Actinomycetota bacterium]
MTTSEKPIITDKEIEECLREILKEEGYSLAGKKGLDKLGPDIRASKNKEKWYIEAIGSEKPGTESARDFYEAFFQAISRLNNRGCKHIAIAISQSSKKILQIRAKLYKVAWKRISEVFPELEIWLVDTENKKYQKTPWGYWLKRK